MPDPIAAAAAGPQAAAAGLPAAAPPNAFDKEMFLQLLVAQLRYQNPLSPMDGNELMAQTAQLTTVEKLTELTDALGAALANDQLSTATGFIGRDVTFTGLDGLSHTDTVTAVRLTATGPMLILGDTEVALGQIEQVSAT